MNLKKLLNIILPILFISLALLSVLSFNCIETIKGETQEIKNIESIRGTSQRIIKFELELQPNDALIRELDDTLFELIEKENLIKTNNPDFNDKVKQLNDMWTELKNEINNVRTGADGKKLFDISENYYELSDETIFIARQNFDKLLTNLILYF
ncbi:MAG: hypothetical protein K0S55_1763, partial [Clostridia bacterium]|nr:hypothetical protein [Clostridia bacterium]